MSMHGIGPRVVCVGSNEESRIALKGLTEFGARVVGVVTLPTHSASDVSDYVDLHPYCSTHDIACIDTNDINGAETLDAIRALEPDYLFVLGWSELLRDEAIAVAAKYAVGSHPTPLPRGRGRAPVPWMILQQEDRGAVSLFRIVRGADAGPLLSQRWFDIPPTIDATALYELVAEVLRDAFCDLYGRLAAGSVTEVLQDEAQASYRARRVPADGLIDFARDRAEVDRLIRAVTHPYPGAYTYYRGNRVVIWRSSLADLPDYHGVGGQILMRRDGSLLVQAGDGPIWVSSFSRDREPMDASDFTVGETLGYRVQDELHALRRDIDEMKARLARS